MNDFRREDRYVVLKRSDLQKHAAVTDLYALDRILEVVALGRAAEGKQPTQQYVVVAADWPEYEVVWELIRARVEGQEPAAAGGSQPVAVNGREATHYCDQCGALWAELPAMEGLPHGGWTLVSATCGQCCDNAPMGKQIVALAGVPAAQIDELSTLRLDCTKPVARVIADILAELQRAGAKFPTWPVDPIHAATVVGEEAGEILKETLQAVYEPHKGTMDHARAEAIQTAAMAIRFVLGMPHYVPLICEQHVQELA